MDRYGETNANSIQDFLDKSELTPIESLKSFYSFMIDINETDKYLSGCIINNMSIEVGRINEAMASKANEQFIGWLTILASVISKGQESKEITKKYSALELAEYLHSGFYGTFSRMKVTRNRTYMDIWLEITFDFIKA